MEHEHLIDTNHSSDHWEHPGFGSSTTVELPSGLDFRYSMGYPSKPAGLCGVTKREHVKLGEWRSTAICGNDITSSTFYASGLCTYAAGTLSPVALLGVGIVLWLFRSIYSEVVLALKLNGGVYAILLNTTSKRVAAFGAVLSVLSYVATCVVSASSAMSYLQSAVPSIDVFTATLVVMAIFALLNLLGTSESANVALAFFVFHICTLFTLLVSCIIAIAKSPQQLVYNWTHLEYGFSIPNPTPATAILFGYGAAMLGVTGFETSSNFVEEQKEGVFPKTLRNMWLAVIFFNPLIAICATGLMPVKEMGIDHRADLLSYMGRISAGPWLEYLIDFDAAVVLCGAVLTSFVGVGGLLQRMACDRCMPQFFLKTNVLGTHHWIIFSFLALCSGLYAMAKGDTVTLGNTYTIAFLSVMTLNAFTALVLKHKRPRLPRIIEASPLRCVLGMAATALAVVVTLVAEPENIAPFAVFYSVGVCVVVFMMNRYALLRWTFLFFRGKSGPKMAKIKQFLLAKMHAARSQPIVFFAKTGDPHMLNKAIQYIRENEPTDNIKIVHAFQSENEIPKDFASSVAFLDSCYRKTRVDLVLVKGQFGLDLIHYVSHEFQVPPNFCFVACPRCPPSELLGVRVITG